MVRYACDFDGTLNMVESDYPGCSHPRKKLFDVLIGLRKKGHKIMLWTLREGELLDIAVAFCKENGLEFDAINCNLQEDIDKWGYDPRKICADYYIDDRNLFVEGVNYE